MTNELDELDGTMDEYDCWCKEEDCYCAARVRGMSEICEDCRAGTHTYVYSVNVES